MTKNESRSNTDAHNTIIIETKSSTGQVVGILSIVSGIIGLFILGIVFFPLSLILAIVALFKRNYLLGGIGVFLSIIVAITSPSIWMTLGIAKLYNTETKKQEQIQRVAQEIVATKKQETIATPPSSEVNFSRVASRLGTGALGTPERSYSDTLKLATNIIEYGGNYLSEVTPMDLSVIAYDPWMEPGIQKIHEQFARAIKENRTEISKFPIGGNGPNIEAITGKYQYNGTGVVLSLKNVYLEVASSAIKKFLATSEMLNESEEEAIKQSLKGLKEAIVALQSGTTPSGPIPVIIYTKDGKAERNSSISISKFPNGTYGIVIK